MLPAITASRPRSTAAIAASLVWKNQVIFPVVDGVKTPVARSDQLYQEGRPAHLRGAWLG